MLLLLNPFHDWGLAQRRHFLRFNATYNPTGQRFKSTGPGCDRGHASSRRGYACAPLAVPMPALLSPCRRRRSSRRAGPAVLLKRRFRAELSEPRADALRATRGATWPRRVEARETTIECTKNPKPPQGARQGRGSGGNLRRGGGARGPTESSEPPSGAPLGAGFPREAAQMKDSISIQPNTTQKPPHPATQAHNQAAAKAA